jgi:hypothetical protein
MIYAEFFKGMEMCHFMNIGKQKLKWVQIGIDGDSLDFSVFSVAEITQLGCPWSKYSKMEGSALPKAKAIGNGSGRKV